MDRETARAIVEEFVKAPGLRRHMAAVDAAMRHYAAKLGEDTELWGIAGRLHDFDWEIHPSLEEHPALILILGRETEDPGSALTEFVRDLRKPPRSLGGVALAHPRPEGVADEG